MVDDICEPMPSTASSHLCRSLQDEGKHRLQRRNAAEKITRR